MVERKHVLVTGGAGFVGSNLVRTLLDRGAIVDVLDDFFTGKEDNLPDHPNLVVHHCCVTDMKIIDQLVKGKDIVFHMAARNIIVSTANPFDDYRVNIGGTLNVLIAGRLHAVPRIVYTSSASIYGNPRHLPIGEEEPANLLSPYAVSKYAGEGYCRSFYESYGVSTAVVRYSNIYGVRQRPDNPYCGVISKFFQCAMNNERMRIHGDGEQTRDFTYVDDAVEATISAGVSAKAEGQVYNVGTGKETSVNELAAIVSQIVGVDEQREHVDRRDIDNIRRRAVNIEKIRRELRWTPLVTLRRGIQLTYEWLNTAKG